MLTGQNTFPKQSRLLHKSEFSAVFDQAKRWHKGGITLLARPNLKQHARLGLAISKKQVRRAVDRNKLKRLIRESFRQTQECLRPVDIVVLVRGKPLQLQESVKCNLKELWLFLKVPAAKPQT